eukprot:m.199791 g.199791  ORF g.199791 m.199791 type:complete len:452 (+) comp18397_c0_seq2:1791-3146(+)
MSGDDAQEPVNVQADGDQPTGMVAATAAPAVDPEELAQCLHGLPDTAEALADLTERLSLKGEAQAFDRIAAVEALLPHLAIKASPEQQGVMENVCRALRFVLRGDKDAIEHFVDLKGVPALMDVVRTCPDYPDVRAWASVALMAVSWHEASRDVVLDQGGSDLLMSIVRDEAASMPELEGACRALANMPNDDILNDAPRIISFLNSEASSTELQAQACRLLKNLIVGQPKRADQLMALNLLERTVPMLDSRHCSLQRESASILWNMSYSSEERAQRAADLGALPPLVRLLSHPDPGVVQPASAAIKNIAAFSETRKRTLVELGCVNKLGPLLRHHVLAVRIEAAGICRNFCAGKGTMRAELCKAGLASLLVQSLEETDGKLLGHVSSALLSLARSDETIDDLVSHDCVAFMEDALARMRDTPEFRDAAENINRALPALTAADQPMPTKGAM